MTLYWLFLSLPLDGYLPSKRLISLIDWLFSCAYGPNRITIYVACPTSVAAVGCPAGSCRSVSPAVSPSLPLPARPGPACGLRNRRIIWDRFSRPDQTCQGFHVAWRIVNNRIRVIGLLLCPPPACFPSVRSPLSSAICSVDCSDAYGALFLFLCFLSCSSFLPPVRLHKISLHVLYMEEWWCL